jgi:hypothetical protein
MSTQRWTVVAVAMAGLVFAVLIVLAGLQGQPGAPTAATTASPSPTVLGATATPATTMAAPTPIRTVTGTLTPSPAPTATPAPARTAEEAARQLASALESSDWQRIRALITPTGWIAAYYQGDGSPGVDQRTPRMMRGEAIQYLRERTPDRRIRADVSESPLLPCREYHPCTIPAPSDADRYIRSVWMSFEGIERQNVHLVLKRDSDGVWYWSAALFRAPD